jgi:tellurite resistance protein
MQFEFAKILIEESVNVSSLVDRFSDHTRRIFARHRGRAFLEGAMAAAALVALADGDASLEEGAEVGRLMRVLDNLRDHNPDQGVESYLKYIDILRNRPAEADKVRAKVVSAAGNDREAASLLVVICNAVSEADGIVRDSEIAEIRKLSQMLGVDAATAVELIAPQSTNV